MEVRSARREDLPLIEDVAHWACAEALGEMVPESVVAAEIQERFRRSVLSEYLLSRRLLVGVGPGGVIELVALIDDRDDHIELTTVVAPLHPSEGLDGRMLISTLRSMGWDGPISSSVALGHTVHEQFHETAGFAPGEVVVARFDDHEIYRRDWWLDPARFAAG